MPYLLKIVFTVVMVLAITEATKRFGFWGSLLASLPIVSIISMVILYAETQNTQKIASFSIQVFWFVLPSLGLFASLPSLLNHYSFPLSLCFASAITILLYLAMLGIFRLCDYHPLG